MCYGFDRQEIVDGLIACHRQGHLIRFGADHGMTTGGRTRDQLSCMKRLMAQGVETNLIKGMKLAPIYAEEGRTTGGGWQVFQHCKTFFAMVPFEGSMKQIVILGSANWTLSSRCNHEMSMMIDVSEHGAVPIALRGKLDGIMNQGQQFTSDRAAAIVRARSQSPGIGPTQRRFMQARREIESEGGARTVDR